MSSGELLTLSLLLACNFKSLLPPAFGTALIVDHTKFTDRTRPPKSRGCYKDLLIFLYSWASSIIFDCIFICFQSIPTFNSKFSPLVNLVNLTMPTNRVFACVLAPCVHTGVDRPHIRSAGRNIVDGGQGKIWDTRGKRLQFC